MVSGSLPIPLNTQQNLLERQFWLCHCLHWIAVLGLQLFSHYILTNDPLFITSYLPLQKGSTLLRYNSDLQMNIFGSIGSFVTVLVTPVHLKFFCNQHSTFFLGYFQPLGNRCSAVMIIKLEDFYDCIVIFHNWSSKA